MADGIDVEIKRHDTPVMQRQLLEADRTPADLTEAEAVVFTMSTMETHLVKEVDRGECSIVDAEDGQVSYAFAANETKHSGNYDGEFEVTWPDEVRTFPNPGYLAIRINDDLG